MKMKKVERGALYFPGPQGPVVAVIPADGRKFTYEELSKAVDGYIERMLPAVRGHVVYVNEEGGVKDLEGIYHTWTFADRHVYLSNGYGEGFRVCGRALEVFKITSGETPLVPDEKRVTITQAVRP